MQPIPKEEGEPLQGKMAKAVQRQAIPEPEEEDPLQGKFEKKPEQKACPSCSPPSVQQKKDNCTGMPDYLKAGVENLSGIDMSAVRVHFNSNKPAKIGALAYTQGTNIHVAPGQERNLPHEAWHVVQQAQGRVQPTVQLKDAAINDDVGLEREADKIGEMALMLTLNKPLQPYRDRAEVVKSHLKPKTNNGPREKDSSNILFSAFGSLMVKNMQPFELFDSLHLNTQKGHEESVNLLSAALNYGTCGLAIQRKLIQINTKQFYDDRRAPTTSTLGAPPGPTVLPPPAPLPIPLLAGNTASSSGAGLTPLLAITPVAATTAPPGPTVLPSPAPLPIPLLAGNTANSVVDLRRGAGLSGKRVKLRPGTSVVSVI